MNVLLIVCTLMSGLITADLDTITTVNGEVLHTNVRKVGKTSILFNETYYKARTVSDLKLSYISSIHFSDGFKVSFTDGVLNREGLLDSRIVKDIMNYSAEGLFNLTDEEMLSYLGPDDYYGKWHPAQKRMDLGAYQIGAGGLLFGLGAFWNSKQAVCDPDKKAGVIGDIMSMLHFARSAFPLGLCQMGMTSLLYGIGEIAANSIYVECFNKGINVGSYSADKAKTRQVIGTGMAIAGMLGALAGTLYWNASFNPNVEYSLFGNREFTGYYYEDDLVIYTEDESGKIDDIGVKDRDFTSYIGPWSVVCSTLLMHYGLSMVVSAKASSPERVKSELTLGAVPGGYGLTYKW